MGIPTTKGWRGHATQHLPTHRNSNDIHGVLDNKSDTNFLQFTEYFIIIISVFRNLV